jgi:NTE family protein
VIIMTTPSKALVLSGGGNAGATWMAGMISALQRQGTDLGDADLIVGTPAAARVGAQLATGTLAQAVEMYRRPDMPAVTVYSTLPQFVAASMGIIAQAPDEQEAARRIAPMGPLGARLASGAERRRMVAAQLPVRQWPAQPLLIAAVDAETGARFAFDADSGAGLVDAVTASGALPGIYPLVTINGRQYADGGAHSLYSADLAAGHDVVRVLSPLPLDDYLRAKLDAEVKALGPGYRPRGDRGRGVTGRDRSRRPVRRGRTGDTRGRHGPGPPGDRRNTRDMAITCQPAPLTPTPARYRTRPRQPPGMVILKAATDVPPPAKGWPPTWPIPCSGRVSLHR